MKCACGNEMELVKVERGIIDREIYECDCGNVRYVYETFGAEDKKKEE